MSETKADIAIVGGGIVGLATAFALSTRDPDRTIVLVEAEPGIARHQTGHNSGVIHAGLYYKPGSRKALHCAAGRSRMYQFCEDHGISHEKCGKLVVATSEAELAALEELQRRGVENGLAGIRRLGPEELREHEPHVNGIAGLHVPETGIVDYREVAATIASLLEQRGVGVFPSSRVSSIEVRAEELVLRTAVRQVRARNLINCGGLQCDRIAEMCGVRPGVRIIPFRGEYYQLVPERESLVRNLIYPVPDPRFPFLGVHFTRMIGGGIEAGPNAVLAFKREGYRFTSFSPGDLLGTLTYSGFWHMARKYWRTGLGEFHRSLSKAAFVKALQKLMPDLRSEDIRPRGAGVRAQAVEPNGKLVDDFHIVARPRMVHVLNAPSPGATASLAIGDSIADMAEEAFGARA